MTDKEIKEKLAEFMGWRKDTASIDYKQVLVWADFKHFIVTTVDNWNPLENISDAMELWNKLIEEDYTLTMSEYRKDPMVIIYIGNGLVEASTKKRAICMAVLKILEEK